MKTNRWIMIVLIVLAVAAGAVGWRKMTSTLGLFYSWIWFDDNWADELKDEFTDRMRRRLTAEQFAVLNGSAADYLELSEKYPDRPWYAVKWFLEHTSNTNILGSDYLKRLGKPLEEQDEKERKGLADFESALHVLRARDPENGCAPMLLAYVEARKGITLGQHDNKTGDIIGNVVDSHHAGEAARLLGEAASKERVTLYNLNMATEWMTILGNPRTFEEFFVALEPLSRTPIWNFMMVRELMYCLTIEARRLISLNDAAAAMDVLRDAQTVSAKMYMDELLTINSAIGKSFIFEVTDSGARAFEEAGYHDEAVELLARGRNLIRPYLLANLMTRSDLDSLEAGDPALTPIENDSSLLDEAKRLLALRIKNTADAPPEGVANDFDRAGVLTSMAFPRFTALLPWTEPPVTRGELVIISNGEAWFMQKVLLYVSIFLMGLTLAALALLFVIHCLAGRPTDAAWPTVRQVVIALALFGAIAALPGLATAGAGNFLWKGGSRFLSWQIFCNTFGLVAAGWALHFWIRPQYDAAAGRPTFPLSRFQWVALACLVLAVPCAFMEYINEPANWRTGFWPAWKYGKMWLLAMVMLLPGPIGAVVCLIRRMIHKRHGSAASPMSSWRLLLMGWAGGTLLCLSSYFLIDWREAAWMERDTVYMPRAASPSYSAIEAKVAKYHGDYVKTVLDSEESAAKNSR